MSKVAIAAALGRFLTDVRSAGDIRETSWTQKLHCRAHVQPYALLAIVEYRPRTSARTIASRLIADALTPEASVLRDDQFGTR